VAVSEEGWSILYADQTDGSLWELSYPQSEMHGGGPQMLRRLTDIEAREKYGSNA